MQCLHSQSVLAFCDVYRFRIYIAERHLSLIHIEQLREKRHTCIIQMGTERQAPRQRASILNNDRVLQYEFMQLMPRRLTIARLPQRAQHIL